MLRSYNPVYYITYLINGDLNIVLKLYVYFSYEMYELFNFPKLNCFDPVFNITETFKPGCIE